MGQKIVIAVAVIVLGVVVSLPFRRNMDDAHIPTSFARPHDNSVGLTLRRDVPLAVPAVIADEVPNERVRRRNKTPSATIAEPESNDAEGALSTSREDAAEPTASDEPAQKDAHPAEPSIAPSAESPPAGRIRNLRTDVD